MVQYYLPRLHRLAYRLLGDAGEAEDVCQEVFMKLWQLAPRWQADAALGTWLHQVALNASRDRLRKRRDLSMEAHDWEVLTDRSPAVDPERSAQHAETQDWLDRAMAALPQRQREALLLCHDQGLNQREAAAVMDIEIGALESLLSRARQSLRQAAKRRESQHEP
nr:sigma-70 family RNA polymerase sigma factor [Pseudomarimonas arenosa]